MIKMLALFAICLMIQFDASAKVLRGNEGAHGGDEVAADFSQSFVRALDNLRQQQPKIYKTLVKRNLESLLNETHIMVVERLLRVTVGSTEQDSVAINYPKDKIVLINRARWSRIHNRHLKEAIALHELLSIRGLEKSGRYGISARYLEMFNLKTSSLLTGVVNLGDDFKTNALVNSPEYLSALLQLQSQIKKTPTGSFGSELFYERTICATPKIDICTGGIAEYYVKISYNKNEGTSFSEDLGHIYGKVKFAEDGTAWVVEIAVKSDLRMN